MTLRSLLSAAVVLATVAEPSLAFDDAQTRDVEKIVRDYLVSHPEVLIEALNGLEAKQAAEEQSKQKLAIANSGSELTSSPEGTILGNPQGSVTVVEFFDYNCGYCKRALSDMSALLAADKDLRFVLKEIPVLGPASEAASRVSLAFREIAPGKYASFHVKLLSSRGVADEARAIAVATSFGVSEAELRDAMDRPSVAAIIERDLRLASQLGITGTPSYVIGDSLLPGAVGLDVLDQKIANVRTCGKADC